VTLAPDRPQAPIRHIQVIEDQITTLRPYNPTWLTIMDFRQA
jgi:hypothetical protein